MKKNTVYLIRYNETSPGVKVITDAFSRILTERGYIVKVTTYFPTELNDDETVITYGPKEAYDAIKRNIPVKLAMLVDNYSLGQLNKAKFFLKRGKIWYKDFWYSLATGLLYRRRENIIAAKIKHLMFVSAKDIEEFKKRNTKNTYYLVPNGVYIPDYSETLKIPSNDIRLGILSNWTNVTLKECQWFIEDILPKLRSKTNLRLIIAGRGASEKITNYFNGISGVEFIGKVDSLKDFFSKVDIYVATVPRGCGILNKVLDAFAYRTFVIGIEESFSGFSKMKKSYVICRSPEDFSIAIDSFVNQGVSHKYIQNATEYISMYNNWDKNYNLFVNELINNRII